MGIGHWRNALGERAPKPVLTLNTETAVLPVVPWSLRATSPSAGARVAQRTPFVAFSWPLEKGEHFAPTVRGRGLRIHYVE